MKAALIVICLKDGFIAAGLVAFRALSPPRVFHVA
jgi:hypothetical protein